MESLIVSLCTMTDGSRTVAEAVLTGDDPYDILAAGTGSSGREPGDRQDAQTGRDLAVARALRSTAARLERRARGRVNHAESVKKHKAEIAEQKAAETPAANKPDYDMAEEQRKPISRRAWNITEDDWNITEDERIRLFNAPW